MVSHLLENRREQDSLLPNSPVARSCPWSKSTMRACFPTKAQRTKVQSDQFYFLIYFRRLDATSEKSVRASFKAAVEREVSKDKVKKRVSKIFTVFFADCHCGLSELHQRFSIRVVLRLSSGSDDTLRGELKISRMKANFEEDSLRHIRRCCSAVQRIKRSAVRQRFVCQILFLFLAKESCV